MGGIWEDRSDLNRGVPCRTARYGTGATCRFSVSGGRGLARAALGVKATYRQVKGSRSLPGPLRSGSRLRSLLARRDLPRSSVAGAGDGVPGAGVSAGSVAGST
jgi:hypothetical protein